MPFAQVGRSADLIAHDLSALGKTMLFDENRNPSVRALDVLTDDEFWLVFDAWSLLAPEAHRAYREGVGLLKIPIAKGKYREYLSAYLMCLLAHGFRGKTRSDVYEDLLNGSTRVFRERANQLIDAIRMYFKVRDAISLFWRRRETVK
jgi:hypothetical protein